jgi:acyl-CoA thioester hydrolase
MKHVFKYPLEVRFRDLGLMGHVNHAVFFTYFAEARLAFFQNITASTDFSTFSFILAHISCDYFRPVTMNSLLRIEITVRNIGTKSFGLLYRIVAPSSDDTVVYATGESVQVCYDYKNNCPKAVSGAFRENLSGYLSG